MLVVMVEIKIGLLETFRRIYYNKSFQKNYQNDIYCA